MSLLINNKNCSSIHFTGIFGSGMSAIAQYLRWIGLEVSGSDRFLNSDDSRLVKEGLLAAGCKLSAQDGTGVHKTTDILCVSTAIEDSNPDIAAARSLDIPVVHRSDVLAAIIATKKTIAVAGTSGKSTVTAMIFEFLTSCGKEPSLISGASLRRLEKEGLIGNAYHGRSDLLVVEADESDGTLVKYKPFLSMILNVSKDHKTVPEIIALFKQLSMQSSTTFINADDAELSSFDTKHSFSINTKASWQPDSTTLHPLSGVIRKNNIDYFLPLPGAHNLSNCAAALCACEYIGCNGEDLAKAVPLYQGVARRFSVIKTVEDIVIIDDFAHNPEKIKAVITAARGLNKKLSVIYQPHGFGPTRFLKNEYVSTFQSVLKKDDKLYLLPIYYAGGSATKDISSQDIIDSIGTVEFSKYAPQNREELLSILKSSLKKDECVLLMGARDPSLSPFALKIAGLFGGEKK